MTGVWVVLYVCGELYLLRDIIYLNEQLLQINKENNNNGLIVNISKRNVPQIIYLGHPCGILSRQTLWILFISYK